MGKRRDRANWQPWADNENPYANLNWYAAALLSVALDMRDDLSAIRRRLDCSSTLAIPADLRRLREVMGRIDARLKKKIPLR